MIVPQISGERRGQLIAYPNIRSFKRTFWDTKVVPALARIGLPFTGSGVAQQEVD